MNPSASVQDDWDRHWTEFGEAAEAGPSPKYRKRLIHELLAEAGCSAKSTVLDIGSGRGELTESILAAYPGARAVGLELSATGVAVASRRVPGAKFLQRDLLQPVTPDQLPQERATHAVCTEVLEHIEEPAVLLRSAAEYMAPGCQLIVTVPGGPMCDFYRHIGHRRHYTTDSLREVLESAGFEVTHTWAAGFPFFNLFRVAITLRGDKLVADATGKPSAGMRAAMALFDWLFRFNLRRWGWQILAVARKG